MRSTSHAAAWPAAHSPPPPSRAIRAQLGQPLGERQLGEPVPLPQHAFHLGFGLGADLLVGGRRPGSRCCGAHRGEVRVGDRAPDRLQGLRVEVDARVARGRLGQRVERARRPHGRLRRADLPNAFDVLP
ncbi:hypothetical protein [Saccharothrix sp.]|uniref:hypothetical protein n=1 Tax=Saccharothrix sp. TaxID=1873460 RepID=UPI0028128459|nr:hypothetical protein [Saccharothrix sp.]